MKLTYKTIAGVAAALSLAVAGAVYAHPAGGMGWQGGHGMGMGYGMGMGMGMGPGMRGGMAGADMAAIAATRTAELKAELKITPAQETAWKAFETSVQQRASAMQAMRAQMHAQVQSQQPGASGPDFTTQRETMLKLHESSQAAVKDLYAVLTPEQRVILDRHPMGSGGPRSARHQPAR